MSAGGSVLRAALVDSRWGWFAIGVFSFGVNLLMLTGPLYMLQVYDRVLASRSVPTLVALTGLVGLLFWALGLLEFVRSSLLSRISVRLESRLGGRAFDAVVGGYGLGRAALSEHALRDLGRLRTFLGSPAPLVAFDLPWTPVFVAVAWLIHAWIGVLAIVGMAALGALALANEVRTQSSTRKAVEGTMASQRVATSALRSAESVEALGMRPVLRRRWEARNQGALAAHGTASEEAARFSSTSKALRLFLQSAVLGLGALLAIEQEISPGTMIAASIIVGRALVPVEQVVAHWRSFGNARSAYRRLSAALGASERGPEPMALPRVEGRLELENVGASPPGVEDLRLQGVSFALDPGEALGVIGPSASGKSTLGRVLVGIWPARVGSLRLDGAELEQWSRAQLGPQIGFLPQDIELLAGRVNENIARFAPSVDPQAVVDAAILAGVHEMILRLPDGYETEIGEGGRHLSAGQRQRVALARAVYGMPALVVLDEPNSNLDAAGDQALTLAIRRLKERGTTVVVIAHRPSAISAVDKILTLEEGRMRAFGRKDEILRQVLRPSTHPLPVAGSA